MSLIATHITAFLQQRLLIERRASGNTCDSYAYAFKLLFEYASGYLKTTPSQLHLEQIDAPLVVKFLNHLETTRRNGASSRNVRLAAIKSFMRYMEYRAPAHWNRFIVFSQSPQRKPTPTLSNTSRWKKCNLFSMRPTRLSGMASGIAPCFICASLEDYVFLSSSGFEWMI